MPDNAAKLKGVDRAAILLLALGEADAAAILTHMGPKEVQELGLAMAGMTNVRTESMETVMRPLSTHCAIRPRSASIPTNIFATC